MTTDLTFQIHTIQTIHTHNWLMYVTALVHTWSAVKHFNCFFYCVAYCEWLQFNINIWNAVYADLIWNSPSHQLPSLRTTPSLNQHTDSIQFPFKIPILSHPLISECCGPGSHQPLSTSQPTQPHTSLLVLMFSHTRTDTHTAVYTRHCLNRPNSAAILFATNFTCFHCPLSLGMLFNCTRSSRLSRQC